jgi:uncharacterized membrane protein YqjE
MDAARGAMQAGRSAAGAEPTAIPTRPHAARPGLESAVGRLWDELRGLLHDQLLLVSLESRQALAGLMRMLILALGCAALLLGAWAVAMTALLMGLVEAGLSVTVALIIILAATLLLAGGSFWLARRSVHEIAFPASLRRLANEPWPPSSK